MVLKTKIEDYLNNNKIIKRIGNAIIFGIGGAVVSKALLMLFNIMVARILGEEKYGVYSIINNTVQTFTVFAGAGIGVTLTRYVALYKNNDKEMTGIVIKTLLIFNLVLSIIISIIVLIFAHKISNMLSEQVDITLYIKITSATILFTSIALILQSILQGFEEYKKIGAIQTISNVITLLIGILITKKFEIMGTIITLLLLQVISTILFAIILKKIIKKDKIIPKLKVNKTIKEAIKNVAVPSFMSYIFVVPLLWITNFIFTKQNGYEEFAAFSVCLQWFTILNYLPQQLGQVRPIYTQLYAENEMNRFKKTIRNMMILSIGFATIAAILLIIFSKIILSTYGNFYIEYTLPFIIMLVASIFYAIQSQYGSVFQAIGKVWLSLLLNILWAISFIVCFYKLYALGTIGYAITYLISYFIYSLVSSMVSYRIINKKEKNYDIN